LLVQSLIAKEDYVARNVLSKTGLGVLKCLSKSTMPCGETWVWGIYGSRSMSMDMA
jgi:hypothetical protein